MATTYHGKKGRFCGSGSASSVTKDGERYKVVRQHRRMKPKSPGKSMAKRSKAEVAKETVSRMAITRGKVNLLDHLGKESVSIMDLVGGGRLDEIGVRSRVQKSKTTADELIGSVETLVRLMDWTPKIKSAMTKIAVAMKKGDKAAVKSLRKVLANSEEVSTGLVNEINDWISGRIANG